MASNDKVSTNATNVALEEAGRQFGIFAKGFMDVLQDIAVEMKPVVQAMLIEMGQAWARRVVEKNT